MKERRQKKNNAGQAEGREGRYSAIQTSKNKSKEEKETNPKKENTIHGTYLKRKGKEK